MIKSGLISLCLLSLISQTSQAGPISDKVAELFQPTYEEVFANLDRLEAKVISAEKPSLLGLNIAMNRTLPVWHWPAQGFLHLAGSASLVAGAVLIFPTVSAFMQPDESLQPNARVILPVLTVSLFLASGILLNSDVFYKLVGLIGRENLDALKSWQTLAQERIGNTNTSLFRQINTLSRGEYLAGKYLVSLGTTGVNEEARREFLLNIIAAYRKLYQYLKANPKIQNTLTGVIYATTCRRKIRELAEAK